MGVICSKRSAVDKSPSERTPRANGFRDQESKVYSSQGDAVKMEEKKTLLPQLEEDKAKQSAVEVPFSFPQIISGQPNDSDGVAEAGDPHLYRALSQKSRSAKSNLAATVKTGASKVSEVSLMLGRASTAGIGKAVEVLDTLGSSMTSINISTGFSSGINMKGNKISILAFEVANTIVKGSNLMQSLSKESIKLLKDVVLPSEGVQFLVSKDMDELLRISASDKREELNVFSGEVVRFGNRCKDPQWHNLDRYFDKLGSENIAHKNLREAAQMIIQQLTTSVQYTVELYHELHALDRFAQDYQRKHQEEESSNVAQRGDNLHILRQELKSQRKHVKGLKKRSLWSRNLEEVIEKLVDVVHFLHLQIHEAFGSSGSTKADKKTVTSKQTLGSLGLSLHYANIISQIDTLVSRSSSVPANTRDNLYQGLPPNIKGALRSQLQSFHISEELSISQIKSEMEKTLRWLIPIANNTTKAHHGFGWVGEWANTGTEMNRKMPGQTDLLRIETLHHADKEKTEAYILNLVVWLHHLINLSRLANGGIRSPIKSPIWSPSQKSSFPLSEKKMNIISTVLTKEDEEMLRVVTYRKITPGISKSQEFNVAKRPPKDCRLIKSNSHSPSSGNEKEFPTGRQLLPKIDFDIDKNKALDVIDRVDML